MRHMTPARLRAVGTLLLEIAGIAVLIAQRVKGDTKLKSSILDIITKARAL